MKIPNQQIMVPNIKGALVQVPEAAFISDVYGPQVVATFLGWSHESRQYTAKATGKQEVMNMVNLSLAYTVQGGAMKMLAGVIYERDYQETGVPKFVPGKQYRFAITGMTTESGMTKVGVTQCAEYQEVAKSSK